MSRKQPASNTAPKHLGAATREWFESICKDYDLESQDLRLLRLAAEAWDRGQEAREAIAEFGLTYTDRFGQPRARPEAKMEIENRTSFARLMRELALDVAPPADAKRPPPLRANVRE